MASNDQNWKKIGKNEKILIFSQKSFFWVSLKLNRSRVGWLVAAVELLSFSLLPHGCNKLAQFITTYNIYYLQNTTASGGYYMTDHELIWYEFRSRWLEMSSFFWPPMSWWRFATEIRRQFAHCASKSRFDAMMQASKYPSLQNPVSYFKSLKQCQLFLLVRV